MRRNAFKRADTDLLHATSERRAERLNQMRPPVRRRRRRLRSVGVGTTEPEAAAGTVAGVDRSYTY